MINSKLKMSNLLEFITIKFKPILLPSSSSPPASFHSTVEPILSTSGVESIHIGQQIEHPELYTVVIRWDSPAAHDAFIASSASTAWHASLRALVAAPPVTNHASFEGNLDAVLSAPVTEIFTAWGTEEDFLKKRMEPFAKAVDEGKLDGYHAIGWGAFDQEAQDGVEVVAGPASRLILGWDSKEAHLQHKDVGSGQSLSFLKTLARTTSLTPS